MHFLIEKRQKAFAYRFKILYIVLMKGSMIFWEHSLVNELFHENSGTKNFRGIR